ncbi:hypothetical protein WJX81_008419 [Elliptochloris bilobata]|uniref:Photosystem I assembly protein Ycf4 n=1 Tax=Elliptochloris bilobata TaxID=381761 RepID=A0AAW1SJ12_9CHLO
MAAQVWSWGEREDVSIKIRSEVEAPFRALRLVFYGFFAVSASVGALIATTQVIAAWNHAPSALPLNDVLQSLGIDLGAVTVFALLFRSDYKAREKQMARLGREEGLSALSLRLATGKRIKLAQLRSFARVVLVAGTPAQVAAAMTAAEPYREELLARGVLVAEVPVFAAATTEAGAAGLATAPPPPVAVDTAGSNGDDVRWRAAAVRPEEWRAWFEEQAGLASAGVERGLYVSLRLDGRVRGSGTGMPPWPRLVAQLPPTDGIFQGLLDGMDGRV